MRSNRIHVSQAALLKSRLPSKVLLLNGDNGKSLFLQKGIGERKVLVLLKTLLLVNRSV